MSNESSTTKSRRVLVAEDETLIRLDIVKTLTDAGYEIVAEAVDGEKAVRSEPGQPMVVHCMGRDEN